MDATSGGRGRVVMFTRDQRIDRRILLEADVLEADGWSVAIIAVPGDANAVRDDPRVVRIDGATRSAGGPWLRAYRALGRWLPVNSPWLKAARALALGLYRGGPEAFALRLFAGPIATEAAAVYVAHDLPMLPVALAARERHGGLVVYDSHELFAEQELSAPERALWRRLEARLIGQCDLVVTVNPSIARELERRYRLADVAVIENAERALPRGPSRRLFHQRLGLPSGVRVLLYQGGLSAGRNLDLPIRALPRVQTADLHLVYLGDGVLGPGLVRLASRLGVSGRVHVLPAVPQAALLDYTASADAGLIPYQPTCLNTRYCTPNKLFEMIAAGLPIIASDLPELRRLVVGHGIGLVGDTATAGSLAALIDAAFAGAGPARFAPALERARELVNWPLEGARLVGLFRALERRAAAR